MSIPVDLASNSRSINLILNSKKELSSACDIHKGYWRNGQLNGLANVRYPLVPRWYFNQTV